MNPDHPSTYIVLDAARCEEWIEEAKEFCSAYDSLYRGSSVETLAEVAPYLFTFERNSEFADWYFQNGWGRGWGIILTGLQSFEECHKHLRKFLLVKDEDGQEIYFRFYDPRVLRIFLPTCTKDQVIEFFGPVKSIIIESINKDQGLQFSHEDGVLQLSHIRINELNNIHCFPSAPKLAS